MKSSWVFNSMSIFPFKTVRLYALTLSLLSSGGALLAQGATTFSSASPGQVVVSGTVPDDASKLLILTRLRDVYGADKVVDQISVGSVIMPPNWSAHVQKLITPDLQQINKGQLKIDGNVVSLRGEVANESQKQKIAGDMAGNLNPSYIVNNSLRIIASGQNVIDKTLANRTIEFESNKSYLMPGGQVILDEMLVTLLQFKSKHLEIIGHTDDSGLPASNLALSQARAETVKSYLTSKGMAPALITAFGAGATRPLFSNSTGEGRAKNRRIEFRLSQ